LSQAISCVVASRDSTFISRTGLRSVTNKDKPIQFVVLERGDFVAAIGELCEVAVSIVLRTVDGLECVLPRKNLEPSVTVYYWMAVLEAPAKCPFCRRGILEKTLIEPRLRTSVPENHKLVRV
jgi:hypothetical protein